MLVPSLLLFYFLIWRPIGVGFTYSLFKLQNYQPVAFAGFDNFKYVFTDQYFLGTLWNTFQYVLWSFAIGFLLPIILATLLNEMVHINSFLKTSIYLPQIVPGIAAALIWYFLFLPGPGGVFNTILMNMGVPAEELPKWLENANLTIPLIIITMTWKGCGGSMLMYLAALQGVNQELYEAAKIDGAGVFRRFFSVSLPGIFPMMLLCAINQIIGVFQVMTEPWTMTDGGPNNASMSLSLKGFKYAFTEYNPEAALALGVVTFLILLVITCFYFRLKNKYSEE